MSIYDEASEIMTEDSENELLVIDHDFRTIKIPKNKRIAGVESDDDVNRLYFSCPRYCSGTDLSDFDFRINYLNVNGEGDIFAVEDKNFDDTTIRFSWLIGRHALKYKGDIRFIVCARVADTEGKIIKEYNTAVHSLTVEEGLEVDTQAIYADNYDIIEQFLQTISMTKHLEDYISFSLVNGRLKVTYA